MKGNHYIGFTAGERAKIRANMYKILSRADSTDIDFESFKREVYLGICRDVQAQRLPPNVRVPSRKHPLDYLRIVHQNVESWPLALASYLSPGSWTLSGGSFLLAEDAGYDITKILLELFEEKGESILLEIGAGYAGFRSEPAQGISKLVRGAGDKMGDGISAHFTNLTNWHTNLPRGVTEHPGYAAREILALKDDGVPNADVIYSQYAAYFDPKIDQFVEGSERMLKTGGLLIFNSESSKEELIKNVALKSGLKDEKEVPLGGANGALHVLRK